MASASSVSMWVKHGWSWRRFGDTWGATIHSDLPETQRECWKTHRWGDPHAVCFMTFLFLYEKLSFRFVKMWILETQNQSSQACLCVPGMLLELPVPVLSQMLQDEVTLTTAVEKALRALQLAHESRYSNGQGGTWSPSSIILNRLDSMWVLRSPTFWARCIPSRGSI